MRVLTLHGIWSGAEAYAAAFASHLRVYDPDVVVLEGHWPDAWVGPLALPLLHADWFRRRCERSVAAVCADGPVDDLILVGHSLGAEILRGFLVRTGIQPRLWVTGGISTLALGTPYPRVPWVNGYYRGDLLSQPLALEGAGCTDVDLERLHMFEEHRRYWTDPAFATITARGLRASFRP